MGAHVFLSFAAADRSLAEDISRELVEAGFDVAAPSTLTPGQSMLDGLRKSLDDSDAVIVLLSGDTLGSGMAMAEVGAALALDKRIVAIRRDQTPPPVPLSHLQMLDGARMSPHEIAATVRRELAG